MARRGAVLALAALGAIGACSPSPRDVVPDTRDVHVAGGADAGPGGGYSWVAKRPRGAIGVAGTRNIAEDAARAIAEHLADELEACARKLEEQGTLASGAARYVAGAGPRGTGELGDLQLAPGNTVAANALMCIVAPVRATPFPPAGDGGVPAVLLEATWAPVHGARAAPLIY